MTSWVFSAPPGGVATILDMPLIILAGDTGSFMPPHWSTSLAAATVILVSYFVSRGLGPFANDPAPFVRVGAAQLYLVTLVVVNFLLTVMLLERRNAYLLLRTSDERYRNFIENSSEAVYGTVELSEPLDPALPVVDQIAWLQTHAYVAEINMAYLVEQADRHFGERGAPMARRRAMVRDHHRSSERGLARGCNGRSAGHRAGRIAATHLHHGISRRHGERLRCVCGRGARGYRAVELDARLRHNQAQLQLYARELVGAEERARRATAVDLHDGIGERQAIGAEDGHDAGCIDGALAAGNPAAAQRGDERGRRGAGHRAARDCR